MHADSQPGSRRSTRSSPPKADSSAAWSARYQVEIDDSQKAFKVDHRRLIDVARAVLAAEQCASATISLAIVDNETIHELNVRYLQHDYPTDVLSFLLECELDEHALPIPKNAPRGCGKRLEGDVIVSAEMAKASAAKYRWKPHDELTLYVVHGLLHLCGYDDATAKEQASMRRREAELLAEWNLTPHYVATV